MKSSDSNHRTIRQPSLLDDDIDVESHKPTAMPSEQLRHPGDAVALSMKHQGRAIVVRDGAPVDHRDDGSVINRELSTMHEDRPRDNNDAGGLPSFARQLSRGPLKKRVASPVPPPPRFLAARSSSSFQHYATPSPLLRQTSSTFSFYPHHGLLPPQVCLNASRGQQLMSQPLLATPKSLLTPASSATPWSLGQSSLRHLSAASKKTPMNPLTPAIKSTIQSTIQSTIGLDMLAAQVMHERPAQTTGCPISAIKSSVVLRAPPHHSRDRALPPPQICLSSMSRGSDIMMHTRRGPLSPSPLTYVQNPTPVRSAYAGASMSARRFVTPAQIYRPPTDPVTAYPALFRQASTSCKPCKCGSTKCLKLYCECFRSGVLCDANLCRCKDCKNNDANNTSKGLREYAILRILAKRPDAFHTKAKRRSGKWCKCQKNHCLKKYCECVSLGRSCSGSCKCLDCQNQETVVVPERTSTKTGSTLVARHGKYY